LLDLLAHASVDHRSDSNAALSVSPSHTTLETPRTEVPSTLERLHQLVKVLAGKQLLFLFDYEGVRDRTFLSNLSPAMTRLLSLYPAAVVQRNPAPPGDEGRNSVSSLSDSSAATSLSVATTLSAAIADGASLGAISGVQIVSYGKGAPPASVPTTGTPSTTGPVPSPQPSHDFTAPTGHEMVVHEVIDSYGPALQACLAVLQTKFEGLKQVQVEDNTFSLTVTHRGADEDEAAAARRAVTALVEEEYPMLRAVEERVEIHIRPEAGWNRARLVEWIVSQVVADVSKQLGHRGIMPIYLGEDPAFRHISAIDGLDILLTGGPAIDSYYLRSPMQVEQLLRWFAEQHAAGVTVRGGKLRPSRAPSQQQHKGQHKGPYQKPPGSVAADGRERSTKRVQILQQDAPGAPAHARTPGEGGGGRESSRAAQ